MRIIISPAKQMWVDTDSFVCTELPVFTDRAEILKNWIRILWCGEAAGRCGSLPSGNAGEGSGRRSQEPL